MNMQVCFDAASAPSSCVPDFAGVVNKQLNNKERVAAALENPALIEVLETCLEAAGRRGQSTESD